MEGDEYHEYHKYEFVLDVCVLKRRIEVLELENKALKDYIVIHECQSAAEAK
jgi:hypothetical protein